MGMCMSHDIFGFFSTLKVNSNLTFQYLYSHERVIDDGRALCKIKHL